MPPSSNQVPAPSTPSLAAFLEGLPAADFEARLASGCDVARRCHRFFPNEIAPAVEFARHVRSGAQSVLIGSPMQSGKTNIMGAIMVLATELTRTAPARFRPRGVYICANNQIDFRSQSMSSLCHHMQVLTLSDRRRWTDLSDTPLIVFYDESHFGDGVRMTINDFLSRHDVFGARRNMIFCGVSATPWSAMGRLDREIVADVSELEAASYNSVGMMLERGRIVEADPLFVGRDGQRLPGAHANQPARIFINEKANAFRHIEDILKRDEIDGYCVVRCLKNQGKKLIALLEERYGDRIYGVEWNQHQREFNADFFKNRRYGRLTVVVVQHKARMGNRIDTQYIHFFHELSPSAHVDTLAQSFIGRACGFHKQEHKTIVYSHVGVAEIYDACMGRAPDMARFEALCDKYDRKPGTRAEIVRQPKGFEVVELDTVTFPRTKNCTRAIATHVNALKRKHRPLLHGRGYVRIRSRWADPKSWDTIDRAKACKPSPGSWAMAIHDCKVVVEGGHERMVATPTVKITMWARTNRRPAGLEPGMRPKENSLFYALAPRTPAQPVAPHPPESDLDANVAAAADGAAQRWRPRPRPRPRRLPATETFADARGRG